MKTATEIKRLQWRGDARLYELSEPHQGFKWIIVSAVDILSVFNEIDDEQQREAISQLMRSLGPTTETYIFGSDNEGNPRDMIELEGSKKGTLDHIEVLDDIGYEVLS